MTVIHALRKSTDDGVQEGHERVMLILSRPGNAVLDERYDTAVLKILDDDFRIFLPLVMRDWAGP